MRSKIREITNTTNQERTVLPKRRRDRKRRHYAEIKKRKQLIRTLTENNPLCSKRISCTEIVESNNNPINNYKILPGIKEKIVAKTGRRNHTLKNRIKDLGERLQDITKKGWKVSPMIPYNYKGTKNN